MLSWKNMKEQRISDHLAQQPNNNLFSTRSKSDIFQSLLSAFNKGDGDVLLFDLNKQYLLYNYKILKLYNLHFNGYYDNQSSAMLQKTHQVYIVKDNYMCLLSANNNSSGYIIYNLYLLCNYTTLFQKFYRLPWQLKHKTIGKITEKKPKNQN